MKEKVCEEPGVFGEWSAFEGLLGELCDHTQGIELLGAAWSGTKGNLGRQEGRPVLCEPEMQDCGCRAAGAGPWERKGGGRLAVTGISKWTN